MHTANSLPSHTHGIDSCRYASGSAATTAVVHLLKSGDHVISIDDVYGGTQRYFRRVCAPAMGLEFDFVDLTQPGAVSKAVRANTKLIWVEAPTNPTLKIVDIAAIAKEAHEHGLIVVVDNTFMSPCVAPFFECS